MPHAHWSEMVWFAASVCGFALTLMSLIASQADRKRAMAQNAVTPMAPTQLAISHIIVVSTRILLTAHTWILISVVAALFLEPPPPAYSQIPQSAIGIGCWIGLSLTLTAQALYGKIERGRIAEGYYELKADQLPHRRATDPQP